MEDNKQMKLFMCITLMVFSCVASADKALLIPMYTPNPTSFDLLGRVKGTGRVKLDVVINSDGGVSSTSLIETDSAEFAEAAQDIVAIWQFKPWTVENGRKPEIKVTIPFLLSDLKGIREGGGVPSNINIALLKMKCRDVNKSFTTWSERHRDTTLNRVRVFWYTEAYLNDGVFMAYNATEEELKVLLATLRSSLGSILSNCRKNPDAMYVDYLPDEIRRFL
jgi:protein TonB